MFYNKTTYTTCFGRIWSSTGGIKIPDEERRVVWYQLCRGKCVLPPSVTLVSIYQTVHFNNMVAKRHL